MREIKFRAWDKEQNKIVKVHELRLTANEVCVDTEFGNSSYKDINKVELMQFTGLKDKNGKEIYEGDIIESSFGKDNPIGDVYWQENRGMWRVDWSEPCCYSTDIFELKDGISKIIGNKFENPELLIKAKKN